MDSILIIWVAIIIGFAIIEAFTITFFPICFSISAIPALILNVLGLDLIWQLVAFALTLTLCLYFLIPFLRKVSKIKAINHSKGVKTNLDMIVGTTGICLEKIAPNKEGLVKVGGKEWTAKVSKDEVIEKNDLVNIEQIKGSKIIVSKKEEK